MEPVEGAVAQHHEDIPLLKLGAQLLDDPVGRWFVEGGLAGSL
jgi:hypothetical protein